MSCITLLGTSRSGYLALAVVMSGSCGVGILVGITTNGTSMSSVTLLGTSRISYNTIAVAVTGSINLDKFTADLFATSTVNYIIISSCSLATGIGVDFHLSFACGMTCCGSENLTTIGTSLRIGTSSRCTGSVRLLASVFNIFSISTMRTGLSCVTLIGTCRSNCLRVILMEFSLCSVGVSYSIFIEHVIGETLCPTSLNIRSLVSATTAVILNAVKDNASRVGRELCHVNIIGYISDGFCANLSHCISSPCC